MLSCLRLPPVTKTFSSYSPNRSSGRYIKFRTSHRENLRYLKALGINPTHKLHLPPEPDVLNHIIATVNFLKSKGISDDDFRRLAFLCPELFSPIFDTLRIEPVFEFLTEDLHATVEQQRGLIVNCPNILFSNVEYCLRPTLDYLRRLGLEKLNVPSKLNAHLLNTRVNKLQGKMRFLKGTVGLTKEEAAKVCARMPAIFGYNIDDNLMPKFEFLVGEMERSLQELKEFPQYFGFSLQKRIAPRHWHLKQRNVKIKLNRMLLWNDDKFYAKWR